MADLIRTPQQKRSIDKKNRIIEAGYELFARDGYFNTNTAQIAKHAGVSTGIVYGYFRDKRDILLEVLSIYIDRVFTPVMDIFENLQAPLDFEPLLGTIIDETVSIHKNNAAIHEALHSLSSTDEAVSNKFLELEKDMTMNIVDTLKSIGYAPVDIYERVHLAMETIQSYAHECVYDLHDYIDYDKMRAGVIKMLLHLFND
ncbi:MAG: TetR/AcrR family transcriptional regulator [Clostridia bacterium]|nr:TetR/AcrR family transcriptional regulator [Clostridia bacterium]